jgi:isopenicillin-N epimerase
LTIDRADSDAAWLGVAAQWQLGDGIVYLNHGSFGPAPRRVIAAREEWFRLLQRDPMDFFARRMQPALAATQASLARFLGTSSANLALVDNATAAVNIVAASVELKPGDEVLTTNHEYGAVLRLWQRRCDRAGARLVVRHVDVPIESADSVANAILSGVTSRTRLLIVSHVTSPTAVVLPVEQICRAARTRAVPVCVDGPHAVAMRQLDLDSLDCDYYTASCHKWLSAAFGAGFLYVHPRLHKTIEPVVVSWGGWPDAQSSWQTEFNWLGTRDPSALLSISTAIEFLESVGLDRFRTRTHDLARYARQRIRELTGLEALVPDSPEWYGSMISLPLPDGPARPLQTAIWDHHRIEVPVFEWEGRRLVRPSCHLYTRHEHVDRLVDALRELLPQYS